MRIATSAALQNRLLAVALSAIAALIGFLVAPGAMQGPVRFVAAWDAGAVTLLLLIWWHIVSADPQKTREWAAAEDPGRIVVFVIDLLASVISFAAAVLLIGHAATSPNSGAIWL